MLTTRLYENWVTHNPLANILSVDFAGRRPVESYFSAHWSDLGIRLEPLENGIYSSDLWFVSLLPNNVRVFVNEFHFQTVFACVCKWTLFSNIYEWSLEMNFIFKALIRVFANICVQEIVKKLGKPTNLSDVQNKIILVVSDVALDILTDNIECR